MAVWNDSDDFHVFAWWLGLTGLCSLVFMAFGGLHNITTWILSAIVAVIWAVILIAADRI